MSEIRFADPVGAPLYDKGGVVQNVRHPAFGATGDGATDDTAAFEAAIATGAREIVIPDGDYVTTRGLQLGFGQTLRGPGRRGITTGGPGARLLYRPTDGSTAAITNAAGAKGTVVEDLTIDLADSGHMGVRWVSSSYGAIRRVSLTGTFDIGVYVYDSYVCEIDGVSTNGASARRGIIYVNLSNGTIIRHLHSSTLPSDPAVAMAGITIIGGKGYTLDTPVLQGPTIGISLVNTSNVVILNPYFENCLCNLRAGDPTVSSVTEATTLIGGNLSGPYSTHPQYASRGPLIYLPRADRVALQNPKFLDTHAADASLWPILATGTTGQLSVYDGHFFNSNVRAEIFRDSAGANPRLTVVGAQYGSNGATELILKADGSAGGNSIGIRADTAGNLTTVGYVPTIMTGSVAPLLTGAVPVITF